MEWKQWFERETEPKLTLLKKTRVLKDSTNTNEKVMTDLHNKEPATHAHPKYQSRSGFKITQILYKKKCFEGY